MRLLTSSAACLSRGRAVLTAAFPGVGCLCGGFSGKPAVSADRMRFPEGETVCGGPAGLEGNGAGFSDRTTGVSATTTGFSGNDAGFWAPLRAFQVPMRASEAPMGRFQAPLPAFPPRLPASPVPPRASAAPRASQVPLRASPAPRAWPSPPPRREGLLPLPFSRVWTEVPPLLSRWVFPLAPPAAPAFRSSCLSVTIARACRACLPSWVWPGWCAGLSGIPSMPAGCVFLPRHPAAPQNPFLPAARATPILFDRSEAFRHLLVERPFRRAIHPLHRLGNKPDRVREETCLGAGRREDIEQDRVSFTTVHHRPEQLDCPFSVPDAAIGAGCQEPCEAGLSPGVSARDRLFEPSPGLPVVLLYPEPQAVHVPKVDLARRRSTKGGASVRFHRPGVVFGQTAAVFMPSAGPVLCPGFSRPLPLRRPCALFDLIASVLVARVGPIPVNPVVRRRAFSPAGKAVRYPP